MTVDKQLLGELDYVALNEDNEVVPAEEYFDTLEDWAEWFDDPENRSIDASVIPKEGDNLVVRTAFFGRDFSTGMEEGEPEYFGTMVFQGGKPVDWFEERFYTTYQEAVEGHQQATTEVREERGGP